MSGNDSLNPVNESFGQWFENLCFKTGAVRSTFFLSYKESKIEGPGTDVTQKHQGPVVKNFVSLTTSLRPQFV